MAFTMTTLFMELSSLPGKRKEQTGYLVVKLAQFSGVHRSPRWAGDDQGLHGSYVDGFQVRIADRITMLWTYRELG